MQWRFLAAVVLLTATLAGCSDDSAKTTDETPVTTPEPFVIGEAPTGQAARDYIESYIMTHPFRQEGQFDSFMATARDDLVGILEGFEGLEVVRETYDGGENIVAYLPGTTQPDQWVVLSAHYDTVGAGGLGPTVYGAWDDGAGTATLIELAHTLSTWKFPYTIAFAFFDGEEKGLVGSQEFVALHTAEGSTVDLVANLNTDPPGLNWPCGDLTGPFPVKIIHETDKVALDDAVGQAKDRYTWLYQAVEAGLSAAEVPLEVRDYSAGIPIATVAGIGLTGGSDHESFGQVGIANVFIGGVPITTIPPGSIPDEAQVAAMTYLLHTPVDTLEQMELRCATGSGTLADGLQTTVGIFTGALSYLAQHPAPPPSDSDAQ